MKIENPSSKKGSILKLEFIDKQSAFFLFFGIRLTTVDFLHCQLIFAAIQ